MAKLNAAPTTSSTMATPKSPKKFKLNHVNNDVVVSLQRRSSKLYNDHQSGGAIKGFDIVGTTGLEE